MVNPTRALSAAAIGPEGEAVRTVADLRLLAARATWPVAALLVVGLLAVGALLEFAHLRSLCTGGPCPDPGWQLSPRGLRELQDLGLSLDLYAALVVAMQAGSAALWIAVAAIVYWRRSGDRMALLAAWFLLSFAMAGLATGPRDAAAAYHPAWWLVGVAVRMLGSLTLGLFVYLFPDGRFVPGWTRWLPLGWVAFLASPVLFPGSPVDSATWPPLLLLAALLALTGSAVFAQVWRYRRVADAVQRKQIKWVVFGLAASLGGWFVLLAFGYLVFSWQELQAGSPWRLPVGTVFRVVMLFIPLSIAVAVLRHRLWDIDAVINRTLVYGALTGCVVGIYVLLVGYLGSLLQAQGDLALSLLATGLIAVAFQPLREGVQRGVNRLMYGQRDEPYAALSRLGRRLEATLAPEAIPSAIARAVAETLKLRYAAVALRRDEGFALVASVGARAPDPVRLPLVHQGETVGELILGARGLGEAFSPADLKLLGDLARQAGVALHAVRLTAELRRSRELLVTAREEERRRLRRDLHDGLGPALAAQSLKIGSARSLLGRDPVAAEGLLAGMEGQMESILGDVRRLVYNLRPPALDELGLVGALRQSAGQFQAHCGVAESSGREPSSPGEDRGITLDAAGSLLRVSPAHRVSPALQGRDFTPRIVVEAPERLPALPAAVEVAAYRIVQEALANVVRHARARTCLVRLSLGEVLEVEVSDDGVGLPAERRAGVGLASMRERAEELGGSCLVELMPTGGTRVVARLPLGVSGDVAIGVDSQLRTPRPILSGVP